MKLVCDACGTKYSIGDDKVAGKVFKIRCKKCSHVIVVRGVVAPVAPAVEAPVHTGDWHAVIDGQQLGPFDRDEVSRRRAAGELDDDSYVWREGMPDWVPLGSIETFRRPAAEDPDPSGTIEAMPQGDATRLRGERNESSVLFTLGNLARLAAPRPAAASPSPGGEGSGLIDIRALASTLVQPAAKPTTTGSMADLPVYIPSGFSDPIVIVPTARRRTPERALVIAIVALAVMLAVVASVLIIIIVGGGSTTEVATAPAPPQIAMAAVAHPGELGVAGTATDVGAPAVTARATPAPAAGGPITAPAPAVVAPAAVATPGSAPTSRSLRSRRTPAPAVTPPAHTTSLHPRQAPEDRCTEVSCEFNDYAGTCCERFKPATTRAAATTNRQLPDDLDRAMLKAGIATIKAQACGDRSSARGDVNVSIKVAPDGAVTRVTVKSSPDAALSACVTAAAQRGSFAKTVRGGSFAYFWRF